MMTSFSLRTSTRSASGFCSRTQTRISGLTSSSLYLRSTLLSNVIWTWVITSVPRIESGHQPVDVLVREAEADARLSGLRVAVEVEGPPEVVEYSRRHQLSHEADAEVVV